MTARLPSFTSAAPRHQRNPDDWYDRVRLARHPVDCQGQACQKQHRAALVQGTKRDRHALKQHGYAKHELRHDDSKDKRCRPAGRRMAAATKGQRDHREYGKQRNPAVVELG